jgi:hypothetical protein
LIQVENYGFQKTTILFFSLYIFILIIDFFELAYTIKCAKVAEKEGYISLEENENDQDK